MSAPRDRPGLSGVAPVAAGPDPSTPALHTILTRWYDGAKRDLPWRRPQAGPWAVLVSEVMLQQTPVQRVLPVYSTWLERWPSPALLAADLPGEAVRLWGRLGYPRRALRLHEAATVISAHHGGTVPASVDELLALPGVGDYTARAVAAFAFGQRQPVVDTNVRRVIARVVHGVGDSPARRSDLRTALDLLPPHPGQAALASVALMELGALLCTARSPRCGSCPLSGRCRWLQVGRPPLATAIRRPQPYAGTDRQVRGLLLAVVRSSPGPVSAAELDEAWPEPPQRTRALASLLVDGLLHELPDGRVALPGHTRPR